MLRLLQRENWQTIFDQFWHQTVSTPAHTHFYYDTETRKIVDASDLAHYYGVSNFSTAAEYFRTLPEREAQWEKDYQKDLEEEMRTTF